MTDHAVPNSPITTDVARRLEAILLIVEEPPRDIRGGHSGVGTRGS